MIEDAGLHDATLENVNMDWKKAEVSAALVLLGGMDAVLTFHQVTAARLDRKMPWGPSTSINRAKTLQDGEYEIEMQSGDTFHFIAGAWSLRTSASPSAA